MSDDNDEEGFSFGNFIFALPPPPNPDPFRNRVETGPVSTRKGALPLSLFGQVDDDHVHVNNVGGFDPNNHKIVSENGSGLNFDGWGFMGGGVLQGNIQDQGSSCGARVEKVVVNVMPLENQAGQDASNTLEYMPTFNGFSLQSNDLFAALPRAVNNTIEKDDGFKPTTVKSNGFIWDAFSGAEDSSNRGGVIVTANNSIMHKPGTSRSLPQSNDLFSDSHEDGNKSSEIDVGHKSTSATTNGFTWDAFSGAETIGNGSEISDTTATSIESKPRSSSFFPPSDDLFAAPLKPVNRFREIDVIFKPANMTINSLSFAAFPEVETIDDRSVMNATSSSSVEHKPNSSSFLFPSDNLFVVPQGAVTKSSETFSGFKETSLASNGFMFDAFPEVESVGYGNGLSFSTPATNEDDDLDDFGDFIDASQEIGTREQQEQVVRHMTVAAETQLENGKPKTLLLNSREALPLSLFGDSSEESSETLNLSDELIHKPTSIPGNGFSGRSSKVSINDLISNLYSQAQTIPSVGSDGKPSDNGVHNSQEKESPPLGEDDHWNDNSWEFKGAFQEAGVREQPLSAIPRNVAQIQLEMSQNVQIYIDFYTELRDSLCFLLSCQLDELQKARCSDTGTGSTEMTETRDNEIEEIHKLLEQNVVSQALSEKPVEKTSCLNEIFNTLEAPNFKMIESKYSLSKNLQMAVNDWKVAADVLRHAISILKSLSLGSADEQFHYVSTWYNIIDVCAQELRYGASIWKRASEMKVQHQVLSHCHGQKHIQALGEIYQVVELLGLSAKVYEAWVLFSVSDSSGFMGFLNECRALWSSLGLEEALQYLSDDIDFGCNETAKALLNSIKNICNVDVLAIHDCVFDQPMSICRISLLPQEMLPDLKTVMWNGAFHFLGLANLWANLISSEPPQLPLMGG